MDFKKAYESIAVLEVEIRTFANEGYAVKYDFGRKVISWRDNYMWNNNFTRSISEDKLALLKTVIPGEWIIKVEFADKTSMKGGAEQHFPKKWKNLKTLIEQTAGCSFALR